ncbi:MAG: DNA-3-methyladenine glycosylase 2 family protein [Actinomycetota bacterium]|nr:DNA-3-methyladenine glycosylase 2 family protein [Actinomycetota bacterium]
MSPATAGRWSTATAVVSGRDPFMAAAVEAVGHCTLTRRRHPGGAFAALARSILYQQLAGRAAAAIHARFVALYGGRPTPSAVLATPVDDLRAAGLSAAKAASVKDLAWHVQSGSLRLDRLSRMDDEQIVSRLSAVRGIGRWTAEMFLIFQLNRPDVWPAGDLGVRAGYARIHGLAAPPAPAALPELGEPYRPYRTAAAWYCWRILDLPTSASKTDQADLW